MVIRKEDLADLDIIDAIELASDGYHVFLTSTLISTSGTENLIIINYPSDGEGILYGKDHLVEAGDRVLLTGTSGGLADGYYIVNYIISDTSFSVTTSIANSTGGMIYFMYEVGAKSVGFNPTGLVSTSAKNVQDAIRDIANNASGISVSQHENLDTLVHNINENSYDEITRTDNKITSIIVWSSPSKTLKIRETQVLRNTIGRVSQIITIQYDASGDPVQTLTETIERACGRINSITRVRT